MENRWEAIQSKHVCIECGRVYGPVTSEYHQQCNCVPKEKIQEKWSGYDFNEEITLCYCCGQESLESGSRWSVWFCRECKEKVVKFNTLFQETVIPIGRHSLMSGYCLNRDALYDSEKISAFLSVVKRLSGRMDVLLEWSAIVIRENITALGYHHDIRLADYVGEAKKTLDKSKAFDRMVEFFSRRAREGGAA